MATITSQPMLQTLVRKLERRATAADVPHDVIARASTATVRALASVDVTAVTERRAEAYFSAVVRRHIVRSASAAQATGRFMAETVVADLQRSGRGPSAVWNELERGWRGTIPAEVLEEYRVRLCA